MLNTEMQRYLAKVDTSGGPDACHLWTGGTFDSGYGRLSLSNELRSTVRSHRWGYEALVGPIPPGEVVRHTCDTPLCHNPRHWILGTYAENSADMVARRRSLTGSRNPNAKLTEADVVLIRQAIAVGGRGTCARLARKYGVTGPLIYAIRDRRAWAHLA